MCLRSCGAIDAECFPVGTRRATREKSGALELESVELSFKLSSDSQPEQIKTPDRMSFVFSGPSDTFESVVRCCPCADLEVHSTIAELMILANVAVANFIKTRLPAVVRLASIVFSCVSATSALHVVVTAGFATPARSRCSQSYQRTSGIGATTGELGAHHTLMAAHSDRVSLLGLGRHT